MHSVNAGDRAGSQQRPANTSYDNETRVSDHRIVRHVAMKYLIIHVHQPWPNDPVTCSAKSAHLLPTSSPRHAVPLK